MKYGRLARLTIAVLSTTNPATAHATLSAQCSNAWQVPHELQLADGRAAYVEAPVAVPTATGTLLLGQPAFTWATRDAFDPAPGPSHADTAAYLTRFTGNFGFAGFVMKPNGSASPVRPPIGVPVMHSVSALQGPDGVTRAVWLSPLSDSANADAPDGAVWYAELRDTVWSVPIRVFSADRLDGTDNKAALLVGENFDIHLIVPYVRNHLGGFAYIRRIRGVWTSQEIPLSGLASQPQLELIGRDSLIVAFVRAGVPGVGGPNGPTGQHVFVIRAAVSDTAWPAPRLVRFSGLGAAWNLGMHASPANGNPRTITLIWRRIASSTESPTDSVYAMVSTDAGLTWQMQDVLSLPFRPAHFRQASDSRGNLHIVVTGSNGVLNPVGTMMYHTVLRNGKGTALDSLQGSVVAPSLSSIGADTMLLAWGEPLPAVPGKPGVVAPVTRYSRLVQECPRSTATPANHHKLRNASIGLVIGGAAGYVYAGNTTSTRSTEHSFNSFNVAGRTIFGALIGTAIGILASIGKT